MSETTDLILEGHICEICGEYMEDGEGYRRTCESCQKEQEEED